MSCRIKRLNTGVVSKVFAENGKESTLYKDLVSAVKNATVEQRAMLQDRYRPWVGKHINNTQDNRELALAIYKQTHSPNFKSSYTGERDGNNEPSSPEVVNKLITAPTEDINKEENQPKYKQKTLDVPSSKASEHTLSAMRVAAAAMGIKIERLSSIEVNGVKLGVAGLADTMKGIAYVAYGKESVAEPEEIAHVITEILKQTGNPLYKQMLNKIGNYQIYKEVLRTYGNQYLTPEGKPDIIKLKEEAMAKLLVENIVRLNQGKVERPELLEQLPIEEAQKLSQSQSWWQSILSWFKNLFQKANLSPESFDPFEEAAAKILDNEDLGDTSVLQGIMDENNFYHLESSEQNNIYNKLEQEHNNTTRTIKDDKISYSRNGEEIGSIISRTPDEEKSGVSKFVDHVNIVGHEDIKDILSRYINKDGYLNRNLIGELIPSESGYISQLSPSNRSAYELLHQTIGEILQSYPRDTKFVSAANIYNLASNKAGTVDLLAMDKDGKTDMLLWRFFTLNTGKYGDVPRHMREKFNTEMGDYKRILKNNYNIKNFGKTRVVPVLVNYKKEGTHYELRGIQAGSEKVSLDEVQPDYLSQIPSSEERIGDKEIDRYLEKLSGLYKQITDRKDKDYFKVTEQLNVIYKAMRDLQTKAELSNLFVQAEHTAQQAGELIASYREQFKKKDISSLTPEQISKQAQEFEQVKDNLQIYSDLDTVFKDFYGPEQQKEQTKLTEAATKARHALSDITKDYMDFAAAYVASLHGIEGLLDAEKEMRNVLTKNLRRLSLQQNTALRTLYQINEITGNHNENEWRDMMNELSSIEKEVSEWGKGGRNYRDLLMKKDKQGEKTNFLIDQYSPEFYKSLRQKIENKDINWVRENINVEGYIEWLKNRRKEQLEQIDSSSYPGSLEEQEALKEKYKSEVMDETDPEGRLAWLNYSNLRWFPLDKWQSNEYKELSKNTPVKKLYDYIRKWNNVATATGYLQKEQSRNFLPFMRKSLMEKVTMGGSWSFLNNFVQSISIDENAVGYGNIDPVTGELKDVIPVYFTHDISEEKKDKQGKTYRDYSGVSENLFSNLAVYIGQVIKYKNTSTIEPQVRALMFAEKNKTHLQTNMFNTIVGDELPGNDVNYEVLEKFVKNTIYGQSYVDNIDLVGGKVGKAYNSLIEKVNKKWDTHLPLMDEGRKVSMNRVIDSANRWYQFKILGVNFTSSITQLMGGSMQAFVNSGKYYTAANYLANEFKHAGLKLIRNDAKIHLAFMKEFLPVEGQMEKEIRQLSENKLLQNSLSNTLMAMMRSADNIVQYANFLSFLDNAIYIDGKIENAREYYRNSKEYRDRYNTPEEIKKIEAGFEDKVAELIDKYSLIKQATLKDGKLVIPGLDMNSHTVAKFKGLIRQTGKVAAGNITREDEMLIRMTSLGRSAMVFKNWVPGLFEQRVSELKYNNGTDSYEWGRYRTMLSLLSQEGLRSIGSLVNILKATPKGVKSLEKLYEAKKEAYEKTNNRTLNMTKEQFYDMVRQNLSGQMKEVAIAIGLIAMFIAAKALAPDKNEDEQTKSFYNYTMRALNRIQDEITFYYNPMSMQSILNGSLFPSLGLLTDSYRVISNLMELGGGYVFQNGQWVDAAHPAKYILKTFPVGKELVNYLALFTPDLAKNMGVKMGQGTMPF